MSKANEMKDLKIFTKNIENEAVKQIDLLLEQEPFKKCKVRVMPDVHAGKGCVIGFTADLGDKVIPNIVGVDIGCGMLCVELGNIDIDLEKLDKIVNDYIPAGRNIREVKLTEFEKIKDLYCLRELKETNKFNRAIGTLGGGNHFIELNVDDEDNKYLVIHTGSRNMGKQVAEYYQNLAIELCSGKEEMYQKKEIDKLCKDCKHYSKADFLECSITKDINGNLFCPYKEKVEQKEIKVRYKFYFSVIQCNRTYSNFIRNCDLGVSDVGSQVEISFTTDKKPTQKNIDKMINILENTKQEESLAQYYTCVKYVRAEII